MMLVHRLGGHIAAAEKCEALWYRAGVILAPSREVWQDGMVRLGDAAPGPA